LRIFLVIWSLGPGGAERVLSTLANEWSEHESVILFTIDHQTPDHYPTSDAIERLRYRSRTGTKVTSGVGPATKTLPRPLPPLIRSAAGLAKETRLFSQLRSELRRVRPDVVVSFMDRTNNQVLLASRGLGFPVVVSDRVDPRFHRISRKARLLRRILYPRADAVVVQTESVRSWYEAFVDPNKVWVIPNPVQPCSEDRQARERMVMGLGRLDRQKGFDVLVEAFSQVSSVFPDWNLTIVGEGPERPMIEALARQLGIEDRVSLPGVVDNPEAYLSRAGVFVLPSRYEGFPNALLEAMACGVPSIATDCPSGPAEIIQPGVNGLLVPSDDADVLAAELVRLLGDGELRRNLGESARVVSSRFAPEQSFDLWEEVFASLRRPSMQWGQS